MKVLVLSRYGNLGASSRYRFYQYFPGLSSRGYSFEVQPMFGNDYVDNIYSGRRISPILIVQSCLRRIFKLLRSKSFDLIWVEKEVLPWMPFSIERLFMPSNVPYIVDYDDAWFHLYDQHRSRAVRAILGKKIDRVMSNAAVVVAGNAYIEQKARQSGAKRVEIVPTVIDLERYDLVAPSDEDGLKIGWIGSPATSQYLHPILPAINLVCQEFGAKLVLVGSGELDLQGVPADIVRWSEENEVEQIKKFDIGIMPLPDEPWTKGKCGLKLIQYMGCSLPVVASPVGVNTEIVENGQNGLLAQSVEEWHSCLTQLCQDKPLREMLGKAGREKVKIAFSLQATTEKLASLFEQAASK